MRKVAAEFGRTFQRNLGKVANLFVTSFSRSAEDLGQWRAYGADGRGFALGFHGSSLETAFVAQEENTTTIQINYDDSKLQVVTERMARLAASAFAMPIGRGLSGPIIARVLTDISTTFSLQLI